MMKLRIKIDKTYSWPDKFFVFLIAISPILQHYKGLFMNGGVTVLLIASPYILVKLMGKRVLSGWALSVIFPMIPFLIFKVVDHGTYVAEFGQVLLLIVFALVFSSRAIDSKLFIQITIKISIIASVLIIIQYICYYLLGFHLQLVPTSLLLDSSNQWIRLAQTGRVGITGKAINFYRPSAFFLEPSHMFLFLFPPLFYELLHPGFDKKIKQRATLISIGIVLSTSGMGTAVTAAAWLLFFAKNGGKDNRISIAKLLSPKNIFIMFGIIAVIVFLYFRVDFFRQSLLRLVSGSGRESVISGRTALGNAFIRRMSGRQLILGISDRYSGIEFNMTGFNGTMYKYGIIGTLLSYVFYIKCLFIFREQHFWITIVIILISFFTAHTHGTFYMLYFNIFLIDGYCSQNKINVLVEKKPEVVY